MQTNELLPPIIRGALPRAAIGLSLGAVVLMSCASTRSQDHHVKAQAAAQAVPQGAVSQNLGTQAHSPSSRAAPSVYAYLSSMELFDYSPVGRPDFLEEHMQFQERIGGVLGSVLGHETSRYAWMTVAGGSAGVYYIRQDHLMRLPRSVDIRSLGHFGPHPAPTRLRVRTGHNYVFFPVCGQSLGPQVISADTSQAVQLQCR